ncbi:MAG: ATP-dependent sacrificial sulfur transferase LarE [Planctomycetia bacterium]|nr:ATP-dependent sacrificial sulfur transferase LarE [Planctomycetia bacterium]
MMDPFLMEENLEKWFTLHPQKTVLGFSGGIDSALLAQAMVRAYEKKILPEILAIFASSPTGGGSLPEEVSALAAEIGIPLQVLESEELKDPEFARNDDQRCYYCKRHRFSRMLEIAGKEALLLDGSNADDQKEYRPGTRAVRELNVRSPLAELNFTKEDIRNLARFWGISIAEKPSEPCLATRIAYGISIEPSLLARIEKGEDLLHELGFPVCRVRADRLDTARIEIPESQFSLLNTPRIREKITEELRKEGFQFIALDLEGFRSGKMNRRIFAEKEI